MSEAGALPGTCSFPPANLVNHAPTTLEKTHTSTFDDETYIHKSMLGRETVKGGSTIISRTSGTDELTP